MIKKAEVSVLKKAEAISHRYLRLTLTHDLKATPRGYLGQGGPESGVHN